MRNIVRAGSAMTALLVSLCLFTTQGARAVFEIEDSENKVINFIVEGDEFRDLASYPGDTAGDGLEANALQSHADKCTALEATLPTLSNDRFVSFECGEPENMASLPNRRHFRSDATLVLKAPFVKSIRGEKILGEEVLASDHADKEYKWQFSRNMARNSYAAACESFQTEMLDQYNASLLYVDCGAVSEAGLKEGWQYYSVPTVFVMSDTSPPEGCDDYAEGEKWWTVDYDNPIREPVDCSSGSGNRVDIFHREVEMQCLDGVKTPTGDERKGKYVDSEGECGGFRDCGDRSHGEYWYHRISPPIERVVHCPGGGSKVEVYERLEENSCFDGVVQSSETVGDYIETIGSCRDARVCVNGTYHGDVWWRTDWNHPIYERRRCGAGGHTTNVYERRVLMRCDYGTIIYTRVSQRGRLIDSYGRCRPPVRHCSNGRRHGERWSQVVSPPIRKRVNCPHGGSKYHLYQRIRTKICRHGSIGTTGGDRPGRHLGSKGKCHPAGKGKGNVGKGNGNKGNGNKGKGNVGKGNGNKGNGNKGKGNVGKGNGNKGNGNKGKGNVGKGNGNKGKGNVGKGNGNKGKGNVGKGNGNKGNGNKGKGNVGKGNGNKGKGNVGKGNGNKGKGNVGKGNGNKGKGNKGKGKSVGNGNRGKGNVGRGNNGNGNRGKGNVGRGNGNRGKGNVGRGNGGNGNRGKGNVGRGNGNRGKGNAGRGGGNRGRGKKGLMPEASLDSSASVELESEE